MRIEVDAKAGRRTARQVVQLEQLSAKNPLTVGKLGDRRGPTSNQKPTADRSGRLV
jgi:hypothetical protein